MGPKKALVVGYGVSHVVGSKVELLRSLGYSVHMFDVASPSMCADLYRPDSLQVYESPEPPRSTKWTTAREQLAEMGRSANVLPEDPGRLSAAKAVLDKVVPDLVWGIWGEGILRWLRILRKAGYAGNMVWTANVFPNQITSPEYVRWNAEGMLYRRWLHRVEGLVLTGRRMSRYIASEYPLAAQCAQLEMPDYLPQSWFARQANPPAVADEPHVVYLGAPERYGSSIDRVDTDLRALGESGIHVHCSQPKEASVQHERVHFYARWSDAEFVNGKFGQFMNQFDAAVVMYNRFGDHPRFASTFPTRFVVALCGRIPVFVRKGLLAACEELVESSGIGKAYKDAVELKAMLADKGLMTDLRANAAHNVERFASDAGENAARLKSFLEGLPGSRRRLKCRPPYR